MRFIIAGGTGLIGKALSADLLRVGHEVVILSRRPDKQKYVPEGAQVIRWNARNGEGWIDLADGAYAVINLAGENISDHRWTEQYKARILESRVNAGKAVVDAVEKAKKKPFVVVQASGIGYYGSREDEELSEEATAGDDFLARVAVAWEDSTKPVDSMNIRRAVIRSGIVLSTEGGALARMLNVHKKFIGGPLGSGNQWFPWIHIHDEVGAIKYIMENVNLTGPFNLVSPNPLRNKDFSKTLGHAIGSPSSLHVPVFVLRALFGEMADALLSSQRAIPRRLLESGFRFNFEKVENAVANLLKRAIT